jgi:hypothetical protein
MSRVAYGLLPILLSAGIGCSSSSSMTPPSTTGAWVPLKVGNQWTYTITETSGKVSAKVQGVVAESVVGGTGPSAAAMAFKLVTGDKFDDKKGDVSYQGVVDSRLVRYREISIGGTSGDTKKEEYYEPPKLRLDESADRVKMGANWPESYTTYTVDTVKSGDAGTPDGGDPTDAALVTTMEQTIDVWTVVGVDESVTVPAGTFKALVVEKVGNSGSSDKKFWFVRGIGKVKETGVNDQTEELSAYTIMP